MIRRHRRCDPPLSTVPGVTRDDLAEVAEMAADTWSLGAVLARYTAAWPHRGMREVTW